MSKMKNKNTMIKFFALFISILLWSYVRGEVNPKAVREFKGINVEYTNERILNDAGLIVLEPKTTKISVKLSGRRSDVNAIKVEEITAQVNLSGASKGSQKILIDVSYPFKVDLEDLSERYVTVEIDKLDKIQMPVEINSKDKEVIISESTISPQVIDISGPSTLIARVAKVIVDVNRDNIKENTVLKLPVKLVDKKGEPVLGLQTNPDMVEILIPSLESKQVRIKPIWTEELEGLDVNDITINPSTVIVRGLKNNIADIEEIVTQAIDISKIKEMDLIETSLVLPRGVYTENGDSKITLKINLDKTSVKTLTIPVTQIDFKNIDEELRASFYDISNAEEISLKLTGNKSELNEIHLKDIKLELDLKDLEEGVHDVKLKITVIKDVIIKSINPETIKIKIQNN